MLYVFSVPKPEVFLLGSLFQAMLAGAEWFILHLSRNMYEYWPDIEDKPLLREFTLRPQSSASIPCFRGILKLD